MRVFFNDLRPFFPFFFDLLLLPPAPCLVLVGDDGFGKVDDDGSGEVDDDDSGGVDDDGSGEVDDDDSGGVGDDGFSGVGDDGTDENFLFMDCGTGTDILLYIRIKKNFFLINYFKTITKVFKTITKVFKFSYCHC